LPQVVALLAESQVSAAGIFCRNRGCRFTERCGLAGPDPALARRAAGRLAGRPGNAHRQATLDQVIARIRTSIFGLRQPRHDPGGLPARLLGIIEEHAPQLGFTADVRFAGPLDLNTNMTLADDILAVTREALSNCARHAHATAVGISLALQDGLITLDIADNGRGPGTTTRSSGLTSMRYRAERNGGTFQLTTPGGGGTHLTWTARGGAP
jgi:signal transduction histidine kinase